MLMTTTLRSKLAAALALTALGCVPSPPEAEPPEVEVSGGELPEYDHDAAELEEEEDELAIDLDERDR